MAVEEQEPASPSADEAAGDGPGASARASDEAQHSETQRNEGLRNEGQRRDKPSSQNPVVLKLSEWLFPLYLAGLAVIFTGERVLAELESGAWIVTLFGAALVLASTILRFEAGTAAASSRRAIERWLGWLSVLGVAGLLIYFVVQGPLSMLSGVNQLEFEERVKAQGIANAVWVAFIALSVVPMLFAELALRPMRRATHPEVRRVRAAAVAGATLSLAAMLGMLIVYSGEKLFLRADYSYFKTSEPSTSTRRIAEALPEPVRVVAFFPDVNPVRREVARYLKDLGSTAPRLRIEFQDRLRVPKLANELKAAKDGMIALARGTVVESVDVGATLERARRKLKTLDRDFQEQLLRVGQPARIAYVTVGHGEIVEPFRPGAAASGRTGLILRELLENQNFQVKDLGISEGLGNAVPEDATVVLILGPSVPFSSDELRALERYAERGGRMLIALDPDMFPLHQLGTDVAHPTAQGAAQDTASDPKKLSPAPPALAPLAALAGLEFSPDVMVHQKQYLRLAFNESDRGRLVINTFSSHPSVSTLSRNAPRMPVAVLSAGSLDRVPHTSGMYNFVLRTPRDTIADRNRNFRHEYDFETDGTFSVAAAVSGEMPTESKAPEPEAPPSGPSETGAGGETDAEQAAADATGKPAIPALRPPAPREKRFFVTADADMFSDLPLQNMEGNRILFVDAVRWLIGEESVAGEVNTEEDHRIEHTGHEDQLWFYSLIFGAPTLVLGLGLAWGRSSRRRSEGAR